MKICVNSRFDYHEAVNLLNLLDLRDNEFLGGKSGISEIMAIILRIFSENRLRVAVRL